MGRRANQRASRGTKPVQVNQKQSAITEFAKRPLVIILSMIITLSGGAPGLYITWNAVFNEKPKFTFELMSTDTFFGEKDGLRFGNYIIACTVLNGGKKTLVPDFYRGYIRYKGKEVKLVPSIMPDSLTLVGQNNEIVRYQDMKSKDLQSIKKLPSDEPINGLLYFRLNADSLTEYASALVKECRVVCVDVYGKEYDSGYITIKNEVRYNGRDKISYPKHGITIGK